MWELVDFKGCSVLISVLILCRYSFISGEAIGGPGALFLEWMWLRGRFLPKEVFSLLLLSKLLRDSDSFDNDVSLLGTKVRPKERISGA